MCNSFVYTATTIFNETFCKAAVESNLLLPLTFTMISSGFQTRNNNRLFNCVISNCFKNNYIITWFLFSYSVFVFLATPCVKASEITNKFSRKRPRRVPYWSKRTYFSWYIIIISSTLLIYTQLLPFPWLPMFSAACMRNSLPHLILHNNWKQRLVNEVHILKRNSARMFSHNKFLEFNGLWKLRLLCLILLLTFSAYE